MVRSKCKLFNAWVAQISLKVVAKFSSEDLQVSINQAAINQIALFRNINLSEGIRKMYNEENARVISFRLHKNGTI